MKDLELLIAMIRQAVEDDPTAVRRAERLRLAQQDRDARAVMAWACPKLMQGA